MSHKGQEFGEFVEENYSFIVRQMWEKECQEIDEIIEEYLGADLDTKLEAKLAKDEVYFDSVITAIWQDSKLGGKLFDVIAQDAEGRYGYDERMEPEYSQER
jgi:hypothetical protein